MINYAKHDEEFYGIFKLVNGEDVLGKSLITEDNGESIVFIQDPVTLEIFTKDLDDGKVARGMGFAKWMQMSDEEFFMQREKDIISLATMSKETIFLYETYVGGEELPDRLNKKRLSLDEDMGLVGTIDEARKLFERIYKNPFQP
ncbi:methylamine utilization [Synechococcus phage S-MbCM6]|uniref:Methylamine protein n=1 Tax=Synechococcus phage S-MbCM6 TaxID=3126011 RepID=H8ZMM1_9CAUD|nr:methylamine utilization [Synechococcus phage ACG-2014c]AFD02732.1 methylamine protein [Synechococcus phage ACG-2014c]